MRTEDYKEKRESLVQELKDYLEAHDADEFKYWDTLEDFRAIVDDLEALREEEIESLSNK